MQETLQQPIETRRHLPRGRSRRLGGVCLRRNIEHPPLVLNNDPLAHIYRLAEARDFDEIEHQIKTEFITDIAERSREQHFYDTFEYTLIGDDLISSTGLSLRAVLEKGLSAAHTDGIAYGIARAEAIASQLPQVIEWARSSSDQSQLAFFSLAPDAVELDATTAKKLFFKQERMMSSNWVFEKSPLGITMHAFSFDNHTLANHRSLLEQLGKDTSSSTSLDEVSRAHYFNELDGKSVIENIRQTHDGLLAVQRPQETFYFGIANSTSRRSANELVLSRPEGYEIYAEAVKASYEALRAGRVTRRLAHLTKELRRGFKGFDSPVAVLNKGLFRKITSDDITELMNYLREKTIPHFVYGGQKITVAESGADAVSRGIKYEGACPTSEKGSAEGNSTTERARLETFLFGRPLFAEKFTSRTCPCCLPSPRAEREVSAWRTEGVYGCENCGHVVDVCGIVIRQGNPNAHTARKR